MPSSMERNSNPRALSYRSGKFIRRQKYNVSTSLKDERHHMIADLP
jgi:hypothetical protein